MDDAEYISELERRLKDIEQVCSGYADDLITTVCKRAIRKMNTWPRGLACSCDEYPSGFKFFDILSIQLQTNYYCDINPHLEDAVENALWCEFQKLSHREQFFVRNSECSDVEWLDDEDVMKLLNTRFNEMYNEHTRLKKIEDFELKRTW